MRENLTPLRELFVQLDVLSKRFKQDLRKARREVKQYLRQIKKPNEHR